VAVYQPQAGVSAAPAIDWTDDRDREVYARLVAVQEAERAHIARELHDVVGQALTAVRLKLLSLDRVNATTGASGAEISDSIATIDAALDQVRMAAFELRPAILDDLGLATALRGMCRRIAGSAGLAVRVRAELGDDRLPQEVETACFRVAQEAITNVVRHAGARRIDVHLALQRRQRLLVLEIRDDGSGFDAGRCGGSRCLGIIGMSERASLVGGNVEVHSEQGAGTVVTARFPVGVRPPAAGPR
jgi:signal transduction histidine kinase